MYKTILTSTTQNVTVTYENDDVFKILNANRICAREDCLSGIISDKVTGKPLRDALVKITDSNFNSFNQVTSDKEGRFSLKLGLLSGIRVIAAMKGYITYTSDVLNPAGISNREMQITMMRAETDGGVVFGYVRDYNGKPLQNVRVSINPHRNPDPSDITVTNQEGSYMFDHIRPGIYNVSCQSPGFENINRSVCHDESLPVHILETVFMRRRDTKGTVYGIVADHRGLPVPNAAVVLFNSENVPLKLTRTNDKGVYLFYDLEMGSYHISAR